MEQTARVSSRLMSARLASTKASDLWERAQIELHGALSIQRVEKMREYARRTNWRRALGVYMVTPLPALAAIALIDCVPLAPPENGSDGNHVYWIRQVIVVIILALGVLQHARCCIPQLPMTQWQWFTVAFVASISSVPVSYCISLLIGFPVPFSFVVNASIGYPMMIGLLWLFWHKTVRDNPHVKANLYRQVLVLMGQMMMMFAFPLYFFFFKLLPPLGQSVFTVLIPIIKLGIKNYFNVTLKDVDDIKAAFVVFNIDLFSALYVANCLQASQSKTNLVIVMAVDVAQLAVAMYELRRVMMQIRSLVRLNEFNGTLLDLCTVVSGKPAAQAEPKSSVRPSRVYAVSAPPEDPPVPTVDRSLTVPDRKPGDAALLLHKIGAVLYMVEFYLLIEFAEVMIPIVYCIYMIVMSNLPNRAYYSQLARLDKRRNAAVDHHRHSQRWSRDGVFYRHSLAHSSYNPATNPASACVCTGKRTRRRPVRACRLDSLYHPAVPGSFRHGLFFPIPMAQG